MPSRTKRVGRKKYPMSPNTPTKKFLIDSPATPVILNADIKKNNAATKKITAIIPCLVWVFSPTEFSLLFLFPFFAMQTF